MADLAVVEDRHVGRSAAQLHDHAAQLAFVGSQHRQRCRERLQDELPHVIAGPLHAAPQVLHGAREDGDQVDLGLEAGAGHADRLVDARLLVDEVVLRDRVQQLVVPAERHVARHVVDAGDVAGPDLVAGDAHHPVRAAARHVLPGDAAIDRAHLDAGHPLGVLHRLGDGAGGFLDVPHHAAADPGAPFHGDAEDLGHRAPRIAAHFRHHRRDLARPEVERRDELPGLDAHAPAPRTTT